MATTRKKATGGGLAAILAALALLWASSSGGGGGGGGTTTTRQAATTVATTRPATTTTTVPVASSIRFGGPTASWNQPVSAFGWSTTWAPYAARWWQWSGTPAPPGDLSLAFRDYSVPIYQATGATTIARFYQTQQSAALYGPSTTGLTNGAPVPWNPAWKPGTGNDALMIILDEAHDQWWELGGLGQLEINCAINTANWSAGWFSPGAPVLCGYGVNRGTGLHSMVDGQTFSGRGMGIPKLALITRPQEVAEGAILHPLEMTISATMFGEPTCAAGAPGAGDTCGFFLPPATRVEWTVGSAGRCGANPTPARSKTVPEGMRFALDITDAQIDAWLDARGYTGPLRTTARIFAVALRDYGWIIAETGCYGNSIELDGMINPDSAALWARLGVADTPAASDMLDGLITQDRVKVVEPPR